jgi:glycosyltransferase involved in cell wall biosynthesis
MHVLFVHQNFPAQFGHVAQDLARRAGFRCSFVSEKPSGRLGTTECIQYRVRGGATAQNHYCSRTFENTIWHAHAVFESLKARPDIRPDLVVGHSGFGSTLFLRELYNCPIVNYFEYFYHVRDSDMDFRPDFPTTELDRLRARARNAMVLLDLENCDAGYSPTHWQRGRFPASYRDKVQVIFDGIDTALWRPIPEPARRVGRLEIPRGVKLVSYATRGMESMRGFDIFMRLAKRLCERRNDVIFVVAGDDRVCYGGDLAHTGGQTFKEWVLARDAYDLSRFHFLGWLAPRDLVQLFCLTDLHIYLTVPFVLSWSLLNALACGSVVLASDTAPVREVIAHEQNGLLADFFDIDRMVELADRVLDDPAAFQPLGRAGVELVRERYDMSVCLPKHRELFEQVAAQR